MCASAGGAEMRDHGSALVLLFFGGFIAERYAVLLRPDYQARLRRLMRGGACYQPAFGRPTMHHSRARC